jgi:hypothetical protein
MKTLVFVVDYKLNNSTYPKTYMVPVKMDELQYNLAEGFKTARLLCREMEYPNLINIIGTKYVKLR